MNWDRKGVFLLLLVVVFWTAVPASACLLSTHSMPHRDCCQAMANACGSPAMRADTSCCNVHGSTPALLSVQPFSPSQFQESAALPDQLGIALPSNASHVYLNASEAPPSKFPPGGAFALRI